MNADLVQWLLYAGFALLGWWLRHQGLVAPKTIPTNPPDHQVLLDLLKTLLDRLPASANPSAKGN